MVVIGQVHLSSDRPLHGKLPFNIMLRHLVSTPANLLVTADRSFSSYTWVPTDDDASSFLKNSCLAMAPAKADAGNGNNGTAVPNANTKSINDDVRLDTLSIPSAVLAWKPFLAVSTRTQEVPEHRLCLVMGEMPSNLLSPPQGRR